MTTTITGATGVNQITDDAITAAKLPAGSVLQVVTMSTTASYIGTTVSFTNTNSTLAITPTSTSSKIVGLITGFALKGNENSYETQLQIVKDGTALTPASHFSIGVSGNTELFLPVTLHFNDSPATTSEITYTLQMRSTNASTGHRWYRKQDVTLMEIAG